MENISGTAFATSLNTSRPYFCQQCGKPYSSKSSLSSHLRYECGKEPTFTCPFCPYKTKQPSNHKRHIVTRHTVEVIVAEKNSTNF